MNIPRTKSGNLRAANDESVEQPYGRFTVRGSSEVEGLLTTLVNEAARAAETALDSREYRALVVLGGYGRGEGGVEIVDGQERPHNNLDFMLIAETGNPKRLQELRQRLVGLFAPIMEKYDIEIDLSVVSVWKLRFSPSLIIWYDMRFGHKTILGDPDFVPSLKHFRLETIPARDVLRLLVNRGTQMVLNELLIGEPQGEQIHRRRIVRNAMKAIIGYGDALLYFLDAYDWSYVERKRRMSERSDVDPEFRALYDEAAEFRFQPDYDRYERCDLEEWILELTSRLEKIHLFCEETRLGVRGLSWDEYPERALSHALFDEAGSARAWARKTYHTLHAVPCPDGLTLRARMGFRTLGPRGLYPIVFPALAYDLRDSTLNTFAAKALNVPGDDRPALREAYLRLWGWQGDINYGSSLRKWGPSSQEPEDSRTGADDTAAHTTSGERDGHVQKER